MSNNCQRYCLRVVSSNKTAVWSIMNVVLFRMLKKSLPLVATSSLKMNKWSMYLSWIILKLKDLISLSRVNYLQHAHPRMQSIVTGSCNVSDVCCSTPAKIQVLWNRRNSERFLEISQNDLCRSVHPWGLAKSYVDLIRRMDKLNS